MTDIKELQPLIGEWSLAMVPGQEPTLDVGARVTFEWARRRGRPGPGPTSARSGISRPGRA